MAEFQDVMKQAKRMCASYGVDCNGCGLRKDGVLCPLVSHTDDHVPMDWNLSNLFEIERIVMDWAAKNPEPVYPSWNEGWRLTFPNGSLQAPCPADFDVRYKPDGGCSLCSSCDVCKARPIPADIAEKLGIKPVGGEDNA